MLEETWIDIAFNKVIFEQVLVKVKGIAQAIPFVDWQGVVSGARKVQQAQVVKRGLC